MPATYMLGTWADESVRLPDGAYVHVVLDLGDGDVVVTLPQSLPRSGEDPRLYRLRLKLSSDERLADRLATVALTDCEDPPDEVRLCADCSSVYDPNVDGYDTCDRHGDRCADCRDAEPCTVGCRR